MEQLFITSTRESWRFPSSKGLLSAEQLWQLPLTSKDGFNLDTVAKAVNATVKQQDEESFVVTKRKNDTPSQQLELVKFIIAVKLDERDQADKRKARKEERDRLRQILDKKNEAALEATSVDELRRRLDELDRDLGA